MASSVTQSVFVISCMVCIFSLGQGTVFHRSAIPAEFLDPENFPSGQHPPIASGEECELVNIPTQENFNSTRFAGKWYLISDYNVDGQVVSNFIDIDDVQAIFHARPRGNMKIQTAARISPKMFNYQVPYMSQCFVGEGVAEKLVGSHTAKFSITYKTFLPDSITNTGRPYWVIGTDYTHYALIYSCFQTLGDGTCNPDTTFAWTLSRRRTGHTYHHRQALTDAATSACLDPHHFRPRDTDSICSQL